MKKITPTGAIGCVIPMHKEVAEGTLKSGWWPSHSVTLLKSVCHSVAPDSDLFLPCPYSTPLEE
jgi:hypothetical protein